MLSNCLHTELRRHLAKLGPRERKIIRERFGFGGGDAMTLEEVAVSFGLTRERIRQLQQVAMRKIRAALASNNAAGPCGMAVS